MDINSIQNQQLIITTYENLLNQYKIYAYVIFYQYHSSKHSTLILYVRQRAHYTH